MNATEDAGYHPVYQDTATAKTLVGGVVMASLGALAAIALAIIALTGALPTTLAAIATAVLGAAVWIERGTEAQVPKQSGSPGAEFLGGLSGIVLGILALLGVAPITLLSIAALVFGATFLLGSAARIGSGPQTIFGLAGLVLGLLAVCGMESLTLVLVALVCLGASALFNSVISAASLAPHSAGG